MILLLLLLTAHFVGDFYLQPLAWVKCRNKHHIKSRGLWTHFIVHMMLYSLVFMLTSSSWLESIIAVLVLSISHLLTDLWKSYQKTNLFNFLIDQLIHLIFICVVWFYYSGFSFEQLTLFMKSLITPQSIIIAIAYILVCKPASVIIALALKKHTDVLSEQSALVSDNTLKNNNMGLVSAGAWIGYIERCLAISFIFMGQFAGIGFLVATKTIFRFGDLTKNKDMKLTEYMLLGTLLSYAIALFIGWNSMQIYRVI